MTNNPKLCRNFKLATYLLWMSSTITTSLAIEQKSKRIHIDKNSHIFLGGLFPVHSKGTNEEDRCGDLLKEKGIQRLEAMLYALDRINSDPAYEPYKFGTTILDTCASDSYALEQSLQFLNYSCGQDAHNNRKVMAVVGAANSDVSESLANIFRLFKIPQVSYASTSEELDDLYKYSYFFRVVPSDKFQVKVIFDILLKMRWTYVSVVVAKGEYGEKAAAHLKDLAGNSTHEVCIATTVILKRDAIQNDYDKAVELLDGYRKAKVVIVFLNEDKISKLLDACDRNYIPEKRFLWLGSDGWGAKERVVKGRERRAQDSLTILPKRYPIKAGFDDYFLSLKPATNSRNPWFIDFWESMFTCRFKGRGKNCTGNEDLRPHYHQEGLVPMVIDSVYVLATAIKALCKDYPNVCDNPEKMEQEHRDKLLGFISNTTMNSSQGRDMVISFDNERSVPVNYTIFQYREIENTFAYEPIGEWNPYERLSFRKSLSWSFPEGMDTKGRPISKCREDCQPGEERMPVSNRDNGRCCWECRPCEGNKYLPAENEKCTECPAGKEVNSDRTECIDIVADYVGKDLRKAWAVVPLVFSVFGLIITSIVFVIFFMHHKTPIIMASGRELCYVILVGIVLCYCFPFIVLLRPSEISCGTLRVCMGLGLSVCYSAIFTKTNRISRIFEVSLKITKRPSYISPGSQVIICVCLVLIQVTLTVLWLIVKPQEPVVPQQVMNPKKWVEACDLDAISIVLGLLYNMILLILCTIYAYKTRNIPENFNETKWISFTMYSSCIVWLAFIPIYCSALQDYKVQSTILSMSVSVSGTVTLVCIFFPKIYIVLFHPERNVRYPSSNATSGTGGTGTCDSQQPVRFLRTLPNNLGALQQSPISKTESPFHFLHKPANNHTANSF